MEKLLLYIGDSDKIVARNICSSFNLLFSFIVSFLCEKWFNIVISKNIWKVLIFWSTNALNVQVAISDISSGIPNQRDLKRAWMARRSYKSYSELPARIASPLFLTFLKRELRWSNLAFQNISTYISFQENNSIHKHYSK